MNLNAVKEFIGYDPKTGRLVWTRHTGFKARGSCVDTKSRYVMLNGERYDKAKVAWYLHTGRWPTKRITFNNGDSNDLRFANLSDGSGVSVDRAPTVEEKLDRALALLERIADALGVEINENCSQ